MRRDLSYWLILIGVAVWIAAIVGAPWARAQEWSMAPVLYRFFHSVCHQIPERSVWWLGHPLAVCHRCLGLYVGFAAGLLAFPVLPAWQRWIEARPRRILFFFAPLLVDVLLVPNTPWTRFLTGAMAAFPLVPIVWRGVSEMLSRRGGEKLVSQEGV